LRDDAGGREATGWRHPAGRFVPTATAARAFLRLDGAITLPPGWTSPTAVMMAREAITWVAKHFARCGAHGEDCRGARNERTHHEQDAPSHRALLSAIA
jgi:hypothetical protein